MSVDTIIAPEADPVAESAAPNPEVITAPDAEINAPIAAPPANVLDMPVDDSATPKTPDWSELRASYAKGDEKLAKRLARYPDVTSALDALIAAQNKISSGRVKQDLPENASAEELAEWRKDNGIPQSAAEYVVKVPDHLSSDENATAAIQSITEYAHSMNLNGAQAQKLVDFVVKTEAESAAAQSERDNHDRSRGVEALRSEWGSEYKVNVNAINGFLSAMPEQLKENLMTARLADGTLFGNSPDALRWMAGVAREINPLASLVPPGPQALATAQDELKRIEAMMGDMGSAYWKGAESKTLQERYLKLMSSIPS